MSTALTATTFSSPPSVSIEVPEDDADEYDPEVDAMVVRCGPDCVKLAETEEVAPGIMLNFDESGDVIGVEILYVSRRAAKSREAA